VGDSCDGDGKLGTVWSRELQLPTEKTSPNTPKGDFSAYTVSQLNTKSAA